MRSLHRYLLLIALPACSLAQTYQCKKPDGGVSFQDQPCQAGSVGAPIVVRAIPPSVDPADSKKVQAPTARDRVADAQRQRMNAATAEKNAQIEARNRETEARNIQTELRNRQSRCVEARRTLGVLKSQGSVFTYNNKGERQYIDNATRQAEMATAEQTVSVYCN